MLCLSECCMTRYSVRPKLMKEIMLLLGKRGGLSLREIIDEVNASKANGLSNRDNRARKMLVRLTEKGLVSKTAGDLFVLTENGRLSVSGGTSLGENIESDNDSWKLNSHLDVLLRLCETKYEQYNHYRAMPPEIRIQHRNEVALARQKIEESIDELCSFVVENDLDSSLAGKSMSSFVRTQIQLRLKRGQGVKPPNTPTRPTKPQVVPAPPLPINPVPIGEPGAGSSPISAPDILGEQHDFRDLIGHLKHHFSKGINGVSCGDERLDSLIRTALKNGELTPIERDFILQKAIEFECDSERVLETVAAMHERNPVFEDVVRAIFSDGYVTNEEIAFLKAKAGELSISEFEANRWWWGIGLDEYENLWRQGGAFSGFVVVLSIWIVIDKRGWTNGKDFNIDVLFDIYGGDSIQEIFNQAYFSLSEKFMDNDFKQDDLDKLFDEIYSSLPPRPSDPEEPKGQPEIGEKHIPLDFLMRLLKEEKRRIGSSDVSLLVENIIYALENEL